MMRCCVALLACWCSVLCGQTAHDQDLSAIREYAVNYAKNLPDYTCTRVTERKDSPVILIFTGPERYGTPQPKGTASTIVIEEELTVSGQRENYKVLKVDGQHFPRADEASDGSSCSARSPWPSSGSVLERIFDAG